MDPTCRYLLWLLGAKIQVLWDLFSVLLLLSLLYVDFYSSVVYFTWLCCLINEVTDMVSHPYGYCKCWYCYSYCDWCWCWYYECDYHCKCYYIVIITISVFTLIDTTFDTVIDIGTITITVNIFIITVIPLDKVFSAPISLTQRACNYYIHVDDDITGLGTIVLFCNAFELWRCFASL